MAPESPRGTQSTGSEKITLTDHSLLRRLRQGSQDAATQLYLRYVQRIYALAESQCSLALARSVDVEDIVQSVFSSFFRGASQGDYDLPPGEHLWKLFLVIALNKIRAKAAYYHAAKRDVHRNVSGEEARHSLESLAAPEGPEYAFLQLAIEEAEERLHPQHRAMVKLRIDGYEVDEISRLMGCSKRTVERILQEARRKLEEIMREEE